MFNVIDTVAVCTVAELSLRPRECGGLEILLPYMCRGAPYSSCYRKELSDTVLLHSESNSKFRIDCFTAVVLLAYKPSKKQIYSVPLGGTIIRQPFAIGGSGSSYLYGFFDQAWKEGMTHEEAEQLVIKAASLAMARDGASGGVVRTVTINAEGVTRKFYGGDTLPLWHEELEPTNSLLDLLSSSVPEPMST